MRAVKRSPLVRIALLSLAVLFAHTGHAATRPIVPAYHPSTVKVAATRLESEKKLSLAITRLSAPARLAHHNSFGGSFDLAATHPAAALALRSPGQTTAVLRTVDILSQRRPFALRI
jgi:hypothetical protein